MKYLIRIAAILCAITCSINFVRATSLIGTSNIVYQPSEYTFANGDQAKGAVYLNGGFKVNAGQGLRMNLSVPVRSIMDLSSTGSIVLENNLQLDPGTVIPNGGLINGGGHTLFLNGHTTIPAMTTLAITSTLVIDGNGHTLLIDNFAQLLVESHSTLTLRNLILKNKNNTPALPPVAGSAPSSKIIFDNVEMKLNNDFWFNNGSFFINNDVVFSNDNNFVYHSSSPSYISTNGTLEFGPDSCFYYYPQNSSNSLISMQDSSCKLIFDGSSLRTTFTGLTLLDPGVLLLSDAVQLNGGTGVIDDLVPYISEQYGINGAPSAYPIVGVVSWSPDGNFLAIGGKNPTSGVGGFNNTNQVRIYQLDLSSSSLLIPFLSIDYGHDATFSRVAAISWSYDGQYLAIAGREPASGAGGFNDTNEIRVYAFNAAAATVIPIVSKAFGTDVYCLNWHPSKYFLLATGAGAESTGIFPSTETLRVYLLDTIASTLDDFAGATCTSTSIRVAKWNPDGTYIAVGDCIYGGSFVAASSPALKVFSFNPFPAAISQRLTLFASIPMYDSAYSANIYTTGLDWTGDGHFIAVGGYFSNNESGYILIYEFDPSDVSPLSLFAISRLFSNNGYAFGCVNLNFSQDDTKIYAVSWVPYSSQDNASVEVFSFNRFGQTQDVILNWIASSPYGSTTFSQYSEEDSMSVQCNQISGVTAIGGKSPEYFGRQPSSNQLQLYNVFSESQSIVDSKIYTYAGMVANAEFSPDENFLALAGTSPVAVDGFTISQNLRVYKFNKVSELLTPLCGIAAGGGGSADLKWSPDGKYIAMSGLSGSNAFGLYQFNGTSFTELISPLAGYTAEYISWHPSGKFLALDSYIEGFNGSSSLMFIQNLSVNVNETCWSPDGQYLAVAGTSDLYIYKFNNFASFTLILTVASGAVMSVDWSKIDNYIAIAVSGGIQVYQFTGSAVNLVASANVALTSTARVRFTPDHRNLVYADTYSPLSQDTDYYFFSFENNTLNQLFYNSSMEHTSLSVSTSGKYVVFGERSLLPAISNSTLVICSLAQSANIYSSDIGLNLGSYLDIGVLAGADVGVNGIVNYTN